MTDVTPLTDEEIIVATADARLNKSTTFNDLAQQLQRALSRIEQDRAEIARLTAELTAERNACHDVEQCHRNDHWRTGDLIAEVDRLTAETERLRGLLKRLEWHASAYSALCPSCREFRPNGHLPGCELRAALDCEA